MLSLCNTGWIHKGIEKIFCVSSVVGTFSSLIIVSSVLCSFISVSATMQHWMDSQGHRENILREQFTMMGVGTRTTDMGITAVQIFGY